MIYINCIVGVLVYNMRSVHRWGEGEGGDKGTFPNI